MNKPIFTQTQPFLVLYTTDIKTTHDFYLQFGGEIRELTEDKVVVNLAGLEFHFILNTTEPMAEYQYITHSKSYGQGIIFYLETKDIHEAKNQIIEAGGTIKTEVFENHWDYLELLFEDPNGYKLAVYQEKS